MARSRSRAEGPSPHRLILDSGAIIALSRGDLRARAALAAAREASATVSIPSVVLAETVRGTARDSPVNRIIKAVGHVTSADEAVGRSAGVLLGAARLDVTVDALIVAGALREGGGVILTADPSDFEALAADQPRVVVQAL